MGKLTARKIRKHAFGQISAIASASATVPHQEICHMVTKMAEIRADKHCQLRLDGAWPKDCLARSTACGYATAHDAFVALLKLTLPLHLSTL